MEVRIMAIVQPGAILDTSKFVRIAVDWLLMSDIGDVIKRIVDSEAFPDLSSRKSAPNEKSAGEKSRCDELTRGEIFSLMDEIIQASILIGEAEVLDADTTDSVSVDSPSTDPES